MKNLNMVLAVSDSDFLIHLAKLKKLDLLNSQFSKIYVSEMIEQETIVQGIKLNKNDAYILKEFFKQGLIQIEKVDMQEISDTMKIYDIHSGESSILILAKKFNVHFILINEPKVRKIARSEGYNVVGTIGIILKAYDLGEINKKNIIKLLKKIQTNPLEFRIHPNLIKKVLQRIQ